MRITDLASLSIPKCDPLKLTSPAQCMLGSRVDFDGVADWLPVLPCGVHRSVVCIELYILVLFGISLGVCEKYCFAEQTDVQFIDVNVCLSSSSSSVHFGNTDSQRIQNKS